jgi:hypothetical protein
MGQDISEALHPFGEPDCESELKALGDRYREYYFGNRFSSRALDPDVYLIVGRRGSGKTALGHFFEFQRTLRNSIAIDVDEPAVFEQVTDRIKASVDQAREFAIPKIAKLWELVIWSAIFHKLRDVDARIAAAAFFDKGERRFSSFVRHVLEALVQRVVKSERNLLEELEGLLAQPAVEEGKRAVLEIAAREPVIVAIDTLENYAMSDEATMRALGALIQCASTFNRDYSRKGIHLKVMFMGEVFPYVKEEVVLNTLKFVRNELHLHWRPKDLMRLICWRFQWYLESTGRGPRLAREVRWDAHEDVLKSVWERYFGRTLVNGRGVPEKTFPYVLRHTQLRPRQLIVLCNSIAKRAERAGTFPTLAPEHTKGALADGDNALADEVVNSYSSVYRNVGRIVDCLTGLPMVFKGAELDRRAKHSAAHWPNGSYSPDAFRQLVAQLGIVGRVRSTGADGTLEADFEYFEEGRLPLLVQEDCVIHPMFYRRLKTDLGKRMLVFPFPDHEEFRELMLEAA